MLRVMYHLNSFRLSYSHRGIISCHQKTFPLSFLFMFLPSIYGGQVYEYKPVAFHGGKLLSFIFKATPSFQTIDGDNTGCLVYRHLAALMTP